MPVNIIFNHSSTYMPELDDNSIQLMITSPPYNVGKEYESDLTLEEWRSMLQAVWLETYRVLKPGGRACINVANTGRKPYLPLHSYIIQDMLDIGYLMRGEIIWHKGVSGGTSTSWGSWLSASNPCLRDVHEYILVFCKDSYDLQADGQSTINPTDFVDSTKSVWKMQTASARNVHHPAPFPIELPRRLIELYSFNDGIVLDPFMGSGTTAMAAQMCQRDYVGYETCEDYVRYAEMMLKMQRMC